MRLPDALKVLLKIFTCVVYYGLYTIIEKLYILISENRRQFLAEFCILLFIFWLSTRAKAQSFIVVCALHFPFINEGQT